MGSTQFYYELGGNLIGPVEGPHLRKLLAEGGITRATRVMRVGEATWRMLAEFEGSLGMMATGGGGGPVAGQSMPYQGLPQGGTQLDKPIEVLPFIFLNVITLGLYGIYKFYKVIESYERLARRQSTFRKLFWWYAGLVFIGGLTTSLGFGVLLILVGCGVGCYLLSEAVGLRDQAAANQLGGIPNQFKSKEAHILTWIAGSVLSFIMIGVIPLILQAIWFFSEYNTIVTAGHGTVATNSLSAPPAFQQRPPTPSRPSIRFCRGCGSSLDSNARFCPSCGSSAVMETMTD